MTKTKGKNTKNKAVIYLRVSSEEQVDNFSLGTQEDICKKEAEKRGFIVSEIFRDEGKSAKSISGRPELIKMIEHCRRNKKTIKAVIVYRLDRISRQTADYLAIRKKLEEAEITIISATEPTGDSPTEKLVETILAGFAQLDNDIRSERSINGLKARYKAGLVNSKPPLGYKMENKMAVKDEETWDLVKKAWDLMATGTKSLAQMAEIMNKWGLKIVVGKKTYKIRAQTINRIFRSKFYMGVLTSNKYSFEVKGQHDPMITEEQFYKVQSILDGRRTCKVAETKRDHENDDFPLRRIVRCDTCGCGFTGAWSKGRNAKYAYYRCSGKCKGSIKPETIEDELVSLLKTITPKEEYLNMFIEHTKKTFQNRKKRLEQAQKRVEKEIIELKETQKTLVSKNLSGIYSDEIFKEQNTIIESKLAEAQIIKESTNIKDYDVDKVVTFAKTLLADLGETYKRSDISQIKSLLGSMFPSGLYWTKNATLNHELSPAYQRLLDVSDSVVPFGVADRI